MGADKLSENAKNATKIYLPKLSAQAQKYLIGILMEKGIFIGGP